MKRWWPILLLGVSLGLNVGLLIERQRTPEPPVSPAATSRRPSPGPPQGAGGNLQRVADELGLEGDRRREFITLNRDFFRETQTLRRDVAHLQRQLRQELQSTEGDRRRIDELIRQLTAAHGDLEIAFVDSFLATCELLDPEQQEIYRQRYAGPAARGARRDVTRGLGERLSGGAREGRDGRRERSDLTAPD